MKNYISKITIGLILLLIFFNIFQYKKISALEEKIITIEKMQKIQERSNELRFLANEKIIDSIINDLDNLQDKTSTLYSNNDDIIDSNRIIGDKIDSLNENVEKAKNTLEDIQDHQNSKTITF